MKPLRILISNDDGVFAEGIRSLAIAATSRGHDVTVVCPDQETVLSAVKEAKDINLINPTLIGDKNLIAETAIKLNLDIKDYNIISEYIYLEQIYSSHRFRSLYWFIRLSPYFLSQRYFFKELIRMSTAFFVGPSILLKLEAMRNQSIIRR